MGTPKPFLTLSFSWIGESRPFSRGITGGLRLYKEPKVALARDAYTPEVWIGKKKQKVSKKKKKKIRKKKGKK